MLIPRSFDPTSEEKEETHFWKQKQDWQFSQHFAYPTAAYKNKTTQDNTARLPSKKNNQLTGIWANCDSGADIVVCCLNRKLNRIMTLKSNSTLTLNITTQQNAILILTKSYFFEGIQLYVLTCVMGPCNVNVWCMSPKRHWYKKTNTHTHYQRCWLLYKQ